MSYQHLTVSVQDRIATLTVNRPDKLNALNAIVIGELGRAIDELVASEDVGAVILTGAGRAFVAGADIAELSAVSALEGRRLARRGQEIFRRFETSPKPTVAAVNGFALGGGCELAMACHVRVAAEGAKFGQPEGQASIRERMVLGAIVAVHARRVVARRRFRESWRGRRIVPASSTCH